MSLSPCWPKSCTWVVSGIYVRVVIYMVKLTRSGTDPILDKPFVPHQFDLVGIAKFEEVFPYHVLKHF